VRRICNPHLQNVHNILLEEADQFLANIDLPQDFSIYHVFVNYIICFMVEVEFPVEMFVLTAFPLLTRECKWNHLNVYIIVRCGYFTSKVEQHGY
jgi:hypothetical protein